MTEDFDKDLEGLAGDLDNLDLGDATGDDPGAEAAADEGAGGESVELDDDLQAMLNDSGDDEPAAAGDADAGGDLGDMLGEEDDAPAGAAAAAPAPAPRRPPPPPPSAGLSDDQVVNLEFLLDIKLHVTFEVDTERAVRVAAALPDETLPNVPLRARACEA